MDRQFIEHCKSYVQEKLSERSILIKYLRDDNGVPYGTVVAVKTDNGFEIGASLCNTKLDNFNRYVGVYIAAQRALKPEALNPAYDVVFRANSAMHHRASKYFKQEQILACPL